jgi:hypothetical protein
MLAAMSKLQPVDHKQCFACYFLQRLPREVRILLSQEPVAEIQVLAKKADALMALHVPQQHHTEAVTPPDPEYAAMAAAAKSGGLKKTG